MKGERITKLAGFMIMAGTLVFFSANVGNAAAKENTTVNVKSTANTGGNHLDGSGTIKTGDATAEAEVKTNIDSSDKNTVTVDATAEANGQKVEAQKTTDQPININEQASDQNSSASVDVNTSSDNSSADQEQVADTDGTRPPQTIYSEAKSIISAIVNHIISFFS
jgi:hypothetical protein